jgi:DNA-binding transcriptional LysR family regulator
VTSMSQLDLNLLRLFDALLTERSVTRAAGRLHLTQSATSGALARLRRALNDPLFIRTSDGLVTTSKAEAMAEPLRQCLARIDQVILEATTFNPSAACDRFQLRAPDHTLRILLPYLMPILAKEAPSLELDFEPLMGDEVFKQLKIGELDILISYFANKAGENLHATRLFTERSVAIASRSHPTIRKSLTLDQYVAAEHVVLRPQGTWSISPIDRALRALGHARKVRMRIGSHLIAPVIVGSSDMIASVPENFAQRFVKEHKVQVFPLPFDVPLFEISMAWHERAHRNPAHRWLRRLITRFRDKE